MDRTKLCSWSSKLGARLFMVDIPSMAKICLLRTIRIFEDVYPINSTFCTELLQRLQCQQFSLCQEHSGKDNVASHEHTPIHQEAKFSNGLIFRGNHYMIPYRNPKLVFIVDVLKDG